MASVCESDESQFSFNYIPVELQLKIFSSLDKWTLLKTVCLVCKSWRDHAFDPIFWQTLNIKSKITPYQLNKLLNRVSLLKNLSIRGTEYLEMVANHSNNFPLLKSFDIGFSDPCTYEQMSLIFQNCPLIETLNCEGCIGFNDACIAVMVEKLKNLRCLNVAHCKFISNEGVIMIAQECKKLNSLNIDGITRIMDSAIITICINLYETLFQLKLDGEELTNSSFRALEKCSKLELLAIPYSEGLTDDGLASIQTLPNLKWLQINKAKAVSSSSFVRFFNSSNFRNLINLDIESPVIDDQAIFKLTETCRLLRSLLLCWCWEISECGLESIVSNCKELTHLDLTGLFLISGLCLVEIPEKLPYLRFLNLQQCNNIVDSILPGINRKVLHLTIVNYYGDVVEPATSEDC